MRDEELRKARDDLAAANSANDAELQALRSQADAAAVAELRAQADADSHRQKTDDLAKKVARLQRLVLSPAVVSA